MNAPAHQALKDAGSLLHLGEVDLVGVCAGRRNAERAASRCVLDGSSARGEHGADEEDLEKGLIVLSVVELGA